MSPFAWQSNKSILFCFPQNSVPRFNLAPVQRLRFQHQEPTPHPYVPSPIHVPKLSLNWGNRKGNRLG